MNNLAKSANKAEASKQMMEIDRCMANTITRRLEIEDRRKEIKAIVRESPLAIELKQLAKEEKQLIVTQHEQNGARKLVFALLRKFGATVPKTSLTQLTERNESARQLIEAGHAS